MRAKSRQRRGPEDSGDRIVPTTHGGHGVRSAGRRWTGWDVARCASREKTPSSVSSASQRHEMTAHEHDNQSVPNGIWDLKIYLNGAKTGHCPTLPKCSFTVSLSGFCGRFDVAGNIFHGIVGLILGFGAPELLGGADLAQRIWKGEPDPAEDQAAIKVGFASVVNNSSFTFESLAAAIKAGINTIATSPECKLCDEGPWNPPPTNP